LVNGLKSLHISVHITTFTGKHTKHHAHITVGTGLSVWLGRGKWPQTTVPFSDMLPSLGK